MPETAECLAIEGHAMDPWATSHPDVLPCRVMEHVTAPPSCGMDYIDDLSTIDKDQRLRSYALLAGHLWRWNLLYGQAPAPSSWIWNTFPDGDDWREATQKYGIRNAVEKVTQPLADTSV